MNKYIYMLAAWLFMPSLVQAQEQWVLVYSAEDQVCQHILSRVNEDVAQNGDVDPGRFPEVQAIQWSSENQILYHNGRDLLTDRSEQNRLTVADINNDGIDEIAQIYESVLTSGAGDHIPQFNFYPINLEDQIYQTGITTNDLYDYRLGGGSVYLNEGAESSNGSIIELINLPIQSATDLLCLLYTSPSPRDS